MSDFFKLSVSKTKTFNQCKKQYEFNYILKLPKKTRDYHIFGKFCHKVLEDFHLVYLEGSDLPYNVVMGNSFKGAMIEYKKDMTPEMKKECWEIIDQYLRLISKNKLSNILACEKTFALSLTENIILNGAIDRIQLDDDGILHVADYKTTKNKKYLKDDWFQLMTYGFILLNEDPNLKKIRGSYILLRHNFEYVTREFSVDELLEMKQQYIDYANKMLNEKEFEPTPSALCSYCDFLEHCPAGKSKSFNNQNVFGEVNW